MLIINKANPIYILFGFIFNQKNLNILLNTNFIKIW